MKRLLMTAFFLVPLAFGQTNDCPDQPVLPTDDLDMSKVVINPVTNEPLVFCRKYCWAGHVLRLEITACDPDEGDPNSPPQNLRLWRVVDSVRRLYVLPGQFDEQRFFLFTLKHQRLYVALSTISGRVLARWHRHDPISCLALCQSQAQGLRPDRTTRADHRAFSHSIGALIFCARHLLY